MGFGWRHLVIFGGGLLLSVACGGFGSSDDDLGVSEIEPTRSDDGAMVMTLDGAGAPPMSSGSGLQVLQVAPMGTERASLQAAVVFDRPMVALSDLDSMTQSVPLRCAPEIDAQVRWAGTSTAVLLPVEKAFPLATAFECTVPKGTTSLDGTVLENEIRWTFETVRPTVRSGSIRQRASDVKPNSPFTVTFNQPVSAAAVGSFISLHDTDADVEIPVRVRPVEGSEDRVEVTPQGGMTVNTAYRIQVKSGFSSTLGDLPATAGFDRWFRTYPPLKLIEVEPKGTSLPLARLELEFSTRVERDVVAEHITLSPPPVDDWEPPGGSYASTQWSYSVRLAPQTEYTVNLAAGITDVFGQELDARTFRFETGDFPPWLGVATGFNIYAANNPKSVPLRHMNIESVDVVIAPVSFESYRDLRWFDAAGQALDDGVTPDISVEGPPNEVEVDELDLAPHLNPQGFGMVAWSVSSPEVFRRYSEEDVRVDEGMALVTDLGATLKVSPGHMEAWVTRLSTGAPVSGVTVEFYHGSTLVHSGTADEDGYLALPDHPSSDWKPWRSEQQLWVVARDGDDWTLTEHDWSDDVSPWSFNIGRDWNGTGTRWVSHGFTDRGVYRPGDPAYARVTWRAQTADGLEIPAADVTWTFRDPQGATLDEGTGKLDDRGGFDVEVTLPKEGALGDYELQLKASGEGQSGTEYLTLQARAYRAPSFRVSVSGPEVAVAGQDVTAHVDARYLFGAPMNAAEVEWSTWKTAEWFHPSAWEGWSFGPEYRWWEEAEEGGGGILDSGSGETLEGAFSLSVKGPRDDSNRPQSLHIEARVTDTDRQVIAASTSVRVHPAAWYSGLKVAERLPSAGAETSVNVIAVDPDGTSRAGESLAIEVVRRTWDRVRQKGMDGRWEYVNTPVDEAVHAEDVTTAAEPVSVSFTPEKAGYYLLTASGEDTHGNPIASTESVYVVGPGYTSWALSDDQRMSLVPEKRSYQPGETARILVKSPREGLSALVTVEREGVLWREIVTLESTASTVEIPIDPAWRPNVFVSVLAVEGAAPQLSPDAGKPQVALGMVALQVDAEAEHLEVAVETDGDSYRPRDTVTATVQVQREGKPVEGAGVTLYAVDEAVLSLTGYRTPNSHSTFYADRGLSVFTGDSRSRILDRAAFLTKGAPPGGGGGEGPTGPELRSDFLTTIAWKPDLRTGPDGRVETSFDLPDNLTTFRIMAVVDAGAVSFGSADREIQVSRPVLLKAALPRFLRTDDTAFAGVVVHNNSGEPRDVLIEAKVEGPVSLTGSPQRIQMKVGEAREVAFELRGQEAGEAVFTFRAESESDRDALEWKIPIQRHVSFDVAATAGTTTDSVVEQIARPDNALTQEGGLDLELATTVLVGSGSGLDYVVDYPHGCVEQITSKGLASLQAIPIREAAGLETTEAELRAYVTSALTKLDAFRHASGGAAYWPGSRHVSVMGTAYVVEFMGRAKAAGFQVDETQLFSHAQFLRDVLNGKWQSDWDPLVRLSSQAYVAVALARAGQGDAGHNSRLYDQRGDLSVLGTASLLEAIARTTGPDPRTANLAKTIQSRTFIEPASASIQENKSRRWGRLWGSDDLSTAASLEALIVLGGQHVLAPKYANHLAGSRRNGHWHNTRATAGVLAALAAYSQAYESSDEAVALTATLAGTSLIDSSRAIPESEQRYIPMADLTNGPLALTASGGRMYYEARLTYAPRVVEARDEGFTVVRSIEIVDGDEDDVIEGGELLRVTLRIVTPVTRFDVAILDPLPAGLEAVNSSFATASRAPLKPPQEVEATRALPAYGGGWVFDHAEVDDDEVRIYADYMPAGIHTYRYVARATTPGTYLHPPATAEEMYEPENFGRTAQTQFTVSGADGETPN
jgi:alpha-2-macroglobulin